MLSRTAFVILLAGLSSQVLCQAPAPTAMGYQIPDQILYESFFYRVLFLDDVVKKETGAKGWSGLPPRDRIQQVVGLTDTGLGTLLAVARDWQAKINVTDQAAGEAGRTARAQEATHGAPSPAALQQIKDLQSKREQLALDGVEQLRAELGPTRFRVLDAYVRRTSRLKMVSVPPSAPKKP